MCDIYMHKCPVCNEEIDMHLSDFNTPREEVAVFHQPCFEKACRVWTEKDFGPPFEGKRPVVVISLSDTALKNKDGNHPNW